MKLTYDIQMHVKKVSYEKWIKQFKYFVFRLTQKLSGTLRPMGDF